MLVPPQWRIAFFTASFPPALRYPLKGVVSRRAASWNSFSAASCGCSGRWMRKKACSRMPDGDRGGRDVCMSTVSEGWSLLLWECDVLFSPPSTQTSRFIVWCIPSACQEGCDTDAPADPLFQSKATVDFLKRWLFKGKACVMQKIFLGGLHSWFTVEPADNIVSRCNAFFPKLNCYFFAFQWIIRSLK